MKDLRKVFTDGNLVDVNVSMWTGERSLQPEDLGLDKEHISDAFKLGRKALVPREITTNFRRLDQSARGVLNKYSFPFAFGGSRFVPKKTFIKFVEAFEEVRQKFQAEVQSLLDNYDKYRIEMRKQYVAAAKSAHKRVQSLRKIEIEESQYINEFIERVESFYPPKEELEKRFNMDYAVFQVALPDLTQASYDDLIEENEKIKMLQMAKQAELQERIRKFVDDTINGMREKAGRVLTHFEESIKGNKKITRASINAVLNMIEEYSDLDIIGDDQFIKQMKDFSSLHVKGLNDAILKDKPGIAKFVCEELRRLVTLAEDKTAINALSEGYKNKIDI